MKVATAESASFTETFPLWLDPRPIATPQWQFPYPPVVRPVTVSPPSPFVTTSEGGVRCDEALMELHRPYPFMVGGAWFVAVRHSEKDGDVGLFSLEE